MQCSGGERVYAQRGHQRVSAGRLDSVVIGSLASFGGTNFVCINFSDCPLTVAVYLVIL